MLLVIRNDKSSGRNLLVEAVENAERGTTRSLGWRTGGEDGLWYSANAVRAAPLKAKRNNK